MSESKKIYLSRRDVEIGGYPSMIILKTKDGSYEINIDIQLLGKMIWEHTKSFEMSIFPYIHPYPEEQNDL